MSAHLLVYHWHLCWKAIMGYSPPMISIVKPSWPFFSKPRVANKYDLAWKENWQESAAAHLLQSSARRVFVEGEAFNEHYSLLNDAPSLTSNHSPSPPVSLSCSWGWLSVLSMRCLTRTSATGCNARPRASGNWDGRIRKPCQLNRYIGQNWGWSLSLVSPQLYASLFLSE